jgi:hypothetical protein
MASKPKTTNPFAGSSDEDDEVSSCFVDIQSFSEAQCNPRLFLILSHNIDLIPLLLSAVLPSWQKIPPEEPPVATQGAAAVPPKASGAAADASSNPFDFDVDFSQVQKRRERARAAKESAKEEGTNSNGDDHCTHRLVWSNSLRLV